MATTRIPPPPKKIETFQDRKWKELLNRLSGDLQDISNLNIVVVGTVPTDLPNARKITGSSGDISVTDGGAGGNVVIDLIPTAVSPGAYTNANITIDANGRITTATSGVDVSSYAFVTIGHPSGLSAERSLVGSSNVTVTDGGANNDVTLDLSNSGVAAATYSYPTNLTVDAKGRITSLTDLARIPQENSDPASPSSNQVWVRKTGGGGGSAGDAFGFLAYTKAGGSATYELRYRTSEGTTVGVALS